MLAGWARSVMSRTTTPFALRSVTSASWCPAWTAAPQLKLAGGTEAAVVGLGSEAGDGGREGSGEAATDGRGLRPVAGAPALGRALVEEADGLERAVPDPMLQAAVTTIATRAANLTAAACPGGREGEARVRRPGRSGGRPPSTAGAPSPHARPAPARRERPPPGGRPGPALPARRPECGTAAPRPASSLPARAR